MKLSFTTISALVAIATASAIPVAPVRVPVPEGYYEKNYDSSLVLPVSVAEKRNVEARAIVSVRVCINHNFEPACTTININSGQCGMSPFRLI